MAMSAIKSREFITAKSRWPKHGVVSDISHFAQRVEQSLNDVTAEGELEVRIRDSLQGLRFHQDKMALRTDIYPNMCRNSDH